MKKTSNSRILGITGAFGTGKSTAAVFLEGKGFARITLSTFLEKEAIRRNLPLTRKILQDIGNEVRMRYGKGILAQKAREEIQKQGLETVVIDGIRNVGEIQVLRAESSFTLVAIVSDRKKRFERLLDAKRREELTWDIFETLDYRDLGIQQEEKGLQVASCIALSDIFIENNGTKEEFLKRLEELVEDE